MKKIKNILIILLVLTTLTVFISSVSAANYTITDNRTIDHYNMNNWMNAADEGSTVIFDIDQCDWEIKINKSLNIKSNKQTKCIGKWDGYKYSCPTLLNITVPM
ncbi:hypothetical protein ALNOE001_11960 [Candidatus Methanobinarius endosymbioticus]|uniref:Uncharacterized protein n=1 Tax=Candidatus Methanobinarius endosymbioticus TaxID=2006182 RepID=A0A366MA30_9EURY|nr:hypothetical protein ALNOE001_11960 [Candidatus Methanobinarius endosymbioticus]